MRERVFLHKSAQNESARDTPCEEQKGVPPHPFTQKGVSEFKGKTERRHIYVQTKPLTLIDLPRQTEWWNALADRYPSVNLEHELLKAMDWHRADLVKSPKLFFRNWVHRAADDAPEELTAEQVRARLAIV